MFSSCWRDSITGSEAGGLFTDGAWVREEGERGRGLGQSLEDPEGELWLAGWEAGAGESWEGVPGRQGEGGGTWGHSPLLMYVATSSHTGR